MTLRLAFVIAGLTGGGAERVISVLANASADRGHEVSVVTLDPETADFYALRPAIRRVHLDIEPASSGPLHRSAIEWRLLRALREELRQTAPDAVISFSTETNVRVLLAATGLGTRVIVSERSDPASLPLGRVWTLLRRVLYRLADLVVLQTDEARRWIDRHTSARRTMVIPNPLAPMRSERAAEAPLPQPLMVAMGRLRPEKGFDLLLDAFSRTRAAHPEWHLAIIGDGPLRKELEQDVASRSLGRSVSFLGQLDDPAGALAQAKLFVLSSRFEGFPNALIEAMSLGLPVISTDCPSGPRAIVRDGVDGVLVPSGDSAALAAQMSRLMGAPDERARLGEAARDVARRFAADTIVSRWLDAARGAPDAPATHGAAPVRTTSS